ncbi:phosphotransferase enzyme family protein [Nereida sp. MMG025]|uniref:phosphotransferase enzyme family protein n=1 Tax=Nereida sp. MMG025 TaxID=2909981 RepID=UPI001F37104C|nr:phosphotransferase [Nereida sp. MMG025]MCF6444709.1 phosphotransferase [Nereida sp. MMG025]
MERLATLWGHVVTPPRLIVERENCVYDVTLSNGRAALRLHRVGYQSRAAIEAELLWTEGLAEQGFPCPRPLRSRAGHLVEQYADGRLASMVTWMDGTALADVAPTPDHFFALGSLLADLHAKTDALNLPQMDRPAWDAAAFTCDTPHWGCYWENTALSEGDRKLLQNARAFLGQYLAQDKWSDRGLIHADVLGENVLVDGNQLRLIDFDDAGYGYRLYDLGTALIQYSDRTDLCAALREGYAKRTPVSEEEVMIFVLMRALASCGWVISRVPKDDPRLAFYANRAVNMARRVL